MLHSFRQMPCPFGAPPLSAPTAAPRARSDTVEETWAALRKERDALRKLRDALREARDALREPRDALAIRGDAVRRRGRDSRRVTGLSRTSPRARPIPRETERVRRELFRTRDDASRIRRDAQRAARDAERAPPRALDAVETFAPTPPRRVIACEGRFVTECAALMPRAYLRDRAPTFRRVERHRRDEH